MSTGLCAVCRREPRGFGWFDANFPVADPRRDLSRRRLCSRACQDICHRRHGMIDPTPNEEAAMTAGGDAAGAYLESLGRSDLATLSPAQWRQLIEIVVTGYCDTLRELAGPGPRPARRHGGKDPLLMSDQSFMERFGPRLVANGHPILPIMPGTKKPGRWRNRRMVGLSRLDASRRTPDHRARARGLAHAGRTRASAWSAGGSSRSTSTSWMPGLALEIERLARERLGETPALRIGRAPKRLLVYRSAEPFAGIRRAPIEVLGLGQQFVAHAIHPDTGQPYAWPEESFGRSRHR